MEKNSNIKKKKKTIIPTVFVEFARVQNDMNVKQQAKLYVLFYEPNIMHGYYY